MIPKKYEVNKHYSVVQHEGRIQPYTVWFNGDVVFFGTEEEIDHFFSREGMPYGLFKLRVNSYGKA